MNPDTKPATAFALSLSAGILMLLGGLVSMRWMSQGMLTTWGGPWGNMMGGWHGMGMGLSPWLSLIFGLLVLVGAILLYAQPTQTATWGIVILVCSVLSLWGMGGFLIGAILGIIGGALAISWRPSSTQNER